MSKTKHNCNDCIKEDVCEWAVYSEVINCNKFVDKQVLERPKGYWIGVNDYYCPQCGADMRKEIKDD